MGARRALIRRMAVWLVVHTCAGGPTTAIDCSQLTATRQDAMQQQNKWCYQLDLKVRKASA